jgi:hypothetical protein
VTDVAQETGKTNDFTAVLVYGLDEEGHLWLHDGLYDRIKPHQIRDALFDLKYPRADGTPSPWWRERPVEAEAALNMTEEQVAYAKLWEPDIILGEDYTYGKALADEMKQEGQRRGQFCRVHKVTVHAGPKKSDRILKALEPMFRAGRMHFRRYILKRSHTTGRQENVTKYLHEEFIHFLLPGAHDDGLDATHFLRPYVAKHWRPRKKGKAAEFQKIPKKDMSLGLEWRQPGDGFKPAPFFEPEPYAVPNRMRRRERSPHRVARGIR